MIIITFRKCIFLKPWYCVDFGYDLIFKWIFSLDKLIKLFYENCLYANKLLSYLYYSCNLNVVLKMIKTAVFKTNKSFTKTGQFKYGEMAIIQE